MFSVNPKWSFAISDPKYASVLQISNNNHTATLMEPTTLWEIAVCDPCKEATTFNIRIVKNKKPSYLMIGFFEQQQDLKLASQNSWLIDSYKEQLVERNKRSHCGCGPIEEGSLITVEKDRSQCTLRFFVDYHELRDNNGQVFGWRKTDLSQPDFDALVPCVWLWTESDGDLTVTIEAEPERIIGREQ